MDQRQRVVVLGMLVTLIVPATGLAQGEVAADTKPPAELAALHALLNRHRTTAGCPPLAWHEPTARVAEAHSKDMALTDYFDHVSPDGLDPGQRLLAGGVTWHGLVAENLAWTPAGAMSAGEMWLDSPPHRANIERCEFTHHGIGAYGDRWTQVLVQNPKPDR
jgi:uncharacterized protein YkwD